MLVVKRNKRLFIETENGEVVYTPPDFIRSKIHSREQLHKLIQRMETVGYIDAVMEFETNI